MRKSPLLLLMLCFSFCLSAQKNKNTNPDLPAFGAIEKKDLEMKSCEFDDKAEAMVLVDDGMLEYTLNRGMDLKRRVRIKILNNKGLEWANIHLRYRNDEGISGLEAQTYNMDASGNVVITKLEKNLVYEKKLNKRYSEKAFTLPAVKVGSVIEYKFKHNSIGLIDWYFQKSIPVRYSNFTVDFPQEIEVSSVPFCAHEYDAKDKSTSNRIVKNYSMSNVPAFRDEPYIINEDHYRDRLKTNVVAFNFDGKRVNRRVGWLDVIKFLMDDEDFGVQIKKNIPRTEDLDAKLKTVTTPYEQMKTVYKYVQNNMEWNEYEGIWALDGVKSAWKDKKGTVGEINLILVNFLKEVGLEAQPILVSTHENGIVNTVDAGTYEAPGFLQFNKVMAYVEIGDQNYVLDATQKSLPVHLIPSEVLMTQGLVIDKIKTMGWGWKNLWKENLFARNNLLISADIDASGKMTGEVQVSSYDYARPERMAAAKKGKDKYIERFVTLSNPGLAVSDVSFENLDSDSLPLVQKVKFVQPLNSAGEYQYFSTNILTGIEQNPFIADNRFSDIFFGSKKSFHITGNFRIPEGYEFEALPKNLKMIMPDTSIVMTRMAQISGNTLMTRIELVIKKPMYTPDEYSAIQEFYLRMFEVLNEQFVIRKKKA
jgi:hypothetical protein